VTTFGQTASLLILLAGIGLSLSSSCGGGSPALVSDNNTGGSAGSAGGSATGGAPDMDGSAGSSSPDDASVGSGGSNDMVYADHLEIPDGAFATGDATLDDDGGEPPLEDAGSTSGDAGGARRYTVYCGARSCSGPTANCCYDSDTTTGTCTAATSKCPTTAGTFACDGPEDCDAREVCCATVSTLLQVITAPNHEYSTRCATTCGTGLILRDTAYAIVCKHPADCGTKLGATCKAVVNMPKGMGVCTGL
jgi:hypothetical protein